MILSGDATADNSAQRLQLLAQVDNRLFNSLVTGVIAANNDALLLILVEASGGAVGEDGAGPPWSRCLAWASAPPSTRLALIPTSP